MNVFINNLFLAFVGIIINAIFLIILFEKILGTCSGGACAQGEMGFYFTLFIFSVLQISSAFCFSIITFCTNKKFFRLFLPMVIVSAVGFLGLHLLMNFGLKDFQQSGFDVLLLIWPVLFQTFLCEYFKKK